MNSTQGCVLDISLREALPDARIFGAGDIRTSSCCSDSRKCRPGDVFVAVLGAFQDGHDFVDDAIERGATAILAERYLPVNVPVCVVPDSRVALGRLCQALAGCPAEQLCVVGVAGTAGKTCTAVLVSAILNAAKTPASVMSSLGTGDGTIRPRPMLNSTPPSELARWLHRIALAGQSHAVAEISSRSLATHQLAGIALDVAVLTNIKSADLDWHGSVANYRAAQARVLDYLKPNGLVVSNADDRGCRSLCKDLDAPVLTYGIHESADVTARLLERHLSQQSFLLMAGDDAITVCTKVIGDEYIYSCLAAATTALALGLDLPQIARGIESIDRIPGRMERLECGQPFGVFVDCSATPNSLATTLNTLRRATSGRVICVFGAEGEKNRTDRPLLGRVLERGAQIGVITSHNPRHESPLRIAHDILDGYSHVAKGRIIVNRKQAIEWALAQAKPGDTVLIAGKGCQNEQLIGNKSIAWDDREIACQWLYGRDAEPEPRILPFPTAVNRKRA